MHKILNLLLLLEILLLDKGDFRWASKSPTCTCSGTSFFYGDTSFKRLRPTRMQACENPDALKQPTCCCFWNRLIKRLSGWRLAPMASARSARVSWRLSGCWPTRWPGYALTASGRKRLEHLNATWNWQPAFRMDC